MKKNNLKGAEGFNNYYCSIYGLRWDIIIESFSKKPNYFEISKGLLTPYYIDKASLFPVKAMDILPGQNILDMCAAPGGKTLLITLLNGEAGTVTANDRSANRRMRLISVLDASLPSDLRKTVKITGHDAALWGVYEKDVYDRILLDAPCSSERHVYLSDLHLKLWSPARIKQLTSRQFAMAAAALDAVKPGGKIVYSTCSISNEENDGIIEKLFRKRKGIFEIENADGIFNSETEFEKSEFGYYIMPDKNKAARPIFFSVIDKRSLTPKVTF